MKRTMNTSLANEHHVIVGQSGTMKSRWLRANKTLREAERRVDWDPDEDHRGARVRSLVDLVDQLRAAGNGPVHLSVSVLPTTENFERFCQVMQVFASAERVTHVVLEEISTVVPEKWTSKAWVWMWTTSRKYGLVVWAVTHSPARVDKLPFRQAKWKWFAGIDDAADRKVVSQNCGVAVDQLDGLHPEKKRGGWTGNALYGSRETGYKRITFRPGT